MAVALRAVAARDRDVELGVAPHAVLRDVEAGRLHLGLDPDPQRVFIVQSAANEAVKVNAPTARSAERPGRRAGGSSPCRRGRRARSRGSPPARAPRRARSRACPTRRPCRARRRRRSDRRCASARPQTTPSTATTPRRRRSRSPPTARRSPHAAVMATSAAMTPFSIIERSGLLQHEPRRRSPRRARPPRPRRSSSARRTRSSRADPPVTTPSVEPGLKPNQPNQRMSTPSVTKAMLWPGIAFGLPVACRTSRCAARAAARRRAPRARPGSGRPSTRRSPACRARTASRRDARSSARRRE